MILDIKTRIPGIVEQVRGKTILIYSMSYSNIEILDTCYRNTVELKENFNINPYQIVAFGDVSDGLSTALMKQIVNAYPYVEKHKNKHLYTCFKGIPPFNIHGLPSVGCHHTPQDSWNCIMEVLLKPKYILILMVKESNIKEFKI